MVIDLRNQTKEEPSFGSRYQLKHSDVELPENVFEALDTETGKLVHIKYLDNISDYGTVEDFLEQAEGVAELKHPNILNIVDFGSTSEESGFIVYEKLNTVKLHSVIEKNGALEIDEAIALVLKIAAGIEFIHSSDFMHGSLSLLDIHLFRDASNAVNTKISGLLDTYPNSDCDYDENDESKQTFFSPEQIETEDYDFRSDVFSLGCILYSAITGKYLNLQDLYKSHSSNELLEIIEDEAIPIPVENIIVKALEYDPENRYQSITELLGAINAVQRLIPKTSRRKRESEIQKERASFIEIPKMVDMLDSTGSISDMVDEKIESITFFDEASQNAAKGLADSIAKKVSESTNEDEVDFTDLEIPLELEDEEIHPEELESEDEPVDFDQPDLQEEEEEEESYSDEIDILNRESEIDTRQEPASEEIHTPLPEIESEEMDFSDLDMPDPVEEFEEQSQPEEPLVEEDEEIASNYTEIETEETVDESEDSQETPEDLFSDIEESNIGVESDFEILSLSEFEDDLIVSKPTKKSLKNQVSSVFGSKKKVKTSSVHRKVEPSEIEETDSFEQEVEVESKEEEEEEETLDPSLSTSNLPELDMEPESFTSSELLEEENPESIEEGEVKLFGDQSTSAINQEVVKSDPSLDTANLPELNMEPESFKSGELLEEDEKPVETEKIESQLRNLFGSPSDQVEADESFSISSDAIATGEEFSEESEAESFEEEDSQEESVVVSEEMQEAEFVHSLDESKKKSYNTDGLELLISSKKSPEETEPQNSPKGIKFYNVTGYESGSELDTVSSIEEIQKGFESSMETGSSLEMMSDLDTPGITTISSEIQNEISKDLTSDFSEIDPNSLVVEKSLDSPIKFSEVTGTTEFKEAIADEKQDIEPEKPERSMAKTLNEIPVISISERLEPEAQPAEEEEEEPDSSEVAKTLNEIPVISLDERLTPSDALESQVEEDENVAKTLTEVPVISLDERLTPQDYETEEVDQKEEVKTSQRNVASTLHEMPVISINEQLNPTPSVELQVSKEVQENSNAIGIAKSADHFAAPDLKSSATDKLDQARSVGRARREKLAATMIGSAIHSNYEKQVEVGASDIYSVYKAKETNTEKVVIAKTLKPLEEAVTVAFVEKAQLHATLLHSNIVRSVGCLDTSLGRPYFIMDYIKGITLESLLESVGRIETPEEFTEIFLQICSALEYAHDRVIYHGNVRPSNILLQEIDGKIVVKVLDFGMSYPRQIYQEITETKPSVYQALYMSPEQFSRSEPTPQSDIYQLGILALKMLTGEEPFQGETYEEIRESMIGESRALPNLAVIRNEIPDVESLYEILKTSLTPDENRRYQTAQELKDAVNRWLQNAQLKLHASKFANSKLKMIIKDQSRLRQTELEKGDTMMMKFTTIASGGARKSPVKTVVYLTAQILFVLGIITMIIMNFDKLQTAWLDTSNALFPKPTASVIQAPEVVIDNKPEEVDKKNSKAKAAAGDNSQGTAQTTQPNQHVDLKQIRKSQSIIRNSHYQATYKNEMVAPKNLDQVRVPKNGKVYPFLYTEEKLRKWEANRHKNYSAPRSTKGDSEIKRVESK